MVPRRDAMLAGAGIVTILLPSAAVATSHDDDTAAGLTVDSTLADDGSVTVSWTDSGSV